MIVIGCILLVEGFVCWWCAKGYLSLANYEREILYLIKLKIFGILSMCLGSLLIGLGVIFK